MDYGSIRESNIERNRKFLQDIGLTAASTDASKPKKSGPKPKRKRTEYDAENVPERRSLRIADLPAPCYKVFR
jgi:hypothetical protein